MADQTEAWSADQQQLDALTRDYQTLFMNDIAPIHFGWELDDGLVQNVPFNTPGGQVSLDVQQDLTRENLSAETTHTDTEHLGLEAMYRTWLDEQPNYTANIHDTHKSPQDHRGDTTNAHRSPSPVRSDSSNPVVVGPAAPANQDVLSEVNLINSTSLSEKDGSRIPEAAKWSLEVFFSQNPYPTAEEREYIALSTGLSSKRVKNWFSNTRARRPAPGDELVYTGPEKRAVRAKLSHESLEKLGEELQAMESPSVMDTYLSTSVEDQDLATAIYQAAQKQRTESHKLHGRQYDKTLLLIAASSIS
ncbi:hypothetical protein BDV96DRAFT_647096 [Lophiotrema nucula]|uniref:Homeobox domain-containing protein n=1 Tax=Lophiotrema nucula TaxID=690887 RepID=A0A6A5Z6F3_9PLEO|nr:hypothetical protein BDV96DRAFT_647096 [Lophiotrema nucula]